MKSKFYTLVILSLDKEKGHVLFGRELIFPTSRHTQSQKISWGSTNHVSSRADEDNLWHLKYFLIIAYEKNIINNLIFMSSRCDIAHHSRISHARDEQIGDKKMNKLKKKIGMRILIKFI